jgi:23S rRNA (cytidine1920-2'-O)/16S rRNA (cytidine1409-2'-O)-methyltransferase
MKRRIDQLLVERGFAESRHKAQALLLAGRILVNEQKIEKLQAALDHFQIPMAGRVCVDLGASTGGFTDCLLQNGASKVYAFDVGQGQLDWKLQTDPRVVVRDKFNVRNLSPADLSADVTFVSIDLAFISVTKILLPLEASLLAGERSNSTVIPEFPIDVVVLVKPQFEVGKGEVGKGGIVRDPDKRIRALETVADFSRQAGYRVVGSLPSPITGAEGNQEFLLYLQLAKGLLSSP